MQERDAAPPRMTLLSGFVRVLQRPGGGSSL